MVLESGGVDPKNLMKLGFMQRLEALYTNISDLVQGEEILELVNELYRLICGSLQLNQYSLERAVQVRTQSL